tara:strand:- start:3711 stop:4289 length:579 start_codon:yes stop_codon:yes gene_type:complete
MIDKLGGGLIGLSFVLGGIATTNKSKTYSLGFFLIFILTVMRFTSSKNVEKEIYDVGHEVLPQAYDKTNDFQLLITAAMLLWKLPGWESPKINSYLTFLIVMYFFRTLTTYVTVLPAPPDRECKKGLLSNCNDFIFSGHTTFNVVTSYFIGAPIWPVWPMITSVGTVASREHYTVDVLLAWLIFFALKSKMP